MTRGNQRDTDRLRAEQRNAKGQANSTLKNRESDAEKLRLKQAAADERKRQQAAGAIGEAGGASGGKRGPSDEEKQQEQERLERLRQIREQEQEKLIREQEEAAERRAEKRRAEAEAKAAQVAREVEAAKAQKAKAAAAKAAADATAAARAAPASTADSASESTTEEMSVPLALLAKSELREALERLIDELNHGDSSVMVTPPLEDEGGAIRLAGPPPLVASARAQIDALLARLATAEAASGPAKGPSSARRACSFGDAPCDDGAEASGAAPPRAVPAAKGAEGCAVDLSDPSRDDADADADAEMEIDIPAGAVGKVIGARGAVINAIRASTGAEISLDKDADGNGTLLALGSAHQLDRVQEIVQHIVVSERSDPDIVAMMEGRGRFGGGGDGAAHGGGGGETDYEMLLHPAEAKLLKQSRMLSSVIRQTGARVDVDNQEGGWVGLTIRGSDAAVEDAKRRLEAIVQPDDGLDGGAFDGRPIAAADEPTFRVEIELTNKDQVGAVIGEGGRTINYIRALAAVDIQVERPSEVREGSTQRRVVITGGESGCQKAKGLVQEVLKSNTGKRDYSQKIDASAASEASGGLVRLSIPRHLVGRIIGTRGATIRRLRDITGAVIDVAKDESGVGTVTINGSPGQVRSAREQIEELTQEDLPLEVQQTLSRMLEEVLVFSVPANRVGKVLGSKGAVIQGLRQQTGVQIDLQKDHDGRATVTLRGSMEGMRAAKAAIEEIVDTTEEGDRIRL